MRFSLRNQKKIEKKLGADYLALLKKSLDVHFTEYNMNYAKIPEVTYPKLVKGKDMQGLHVPSVHPRSDIDFEFIIYGRCYDVLHLSYYSSIG